ncbi:MAG: aminoacetone oxidase family FAD-binding enzyme [Desulfovibrio desulfuricans]|nr:aminoacetone oxidase family FAD-binding enzyme [Desulfovibrio desulfuricans]
MLSNPARDARGPRPACPKRPGEPPRKRDCGAPAARPRRPAGSSPGKGGSAVDVLVLGGGASGLMCAREAAGRGLRVVVLERGATPARKLCVSGGGKANFTNRNVSPADYLCHGAQGSGFCRPALADCPPERIMRLIDGWRLPFEERGHGQLFLTVPARRLAEALLRDCRERGCRILCNTPVTDARAAGGGFLVRTPAGSWQGANLVLALGSPACPQAGGSGAGYRLAQLLGHRVLPPRPALTPLLLAAEDPLKALAGVSLPVRVTLGERSWVDDLLFTHEGLSGPAILKVSLFRGEGESLELDFLPGQDAAALLDAMPAGRQTPRALLARHLPQRLVDAILPEATARRKIAELSRAARAALADAVQRHVLTPCGAGGLKKAEVCAGGVDTDEVRPETLGSRLQPGLYFAGEVLDVTGLLGGYNLHWAWACGLLAGKCLMRG